MIIATLGKLSVAQAITASDEDSTGVILMPALDYAALTDVWWVVDTVVIAAGDGSDTLDFTLVLSQEETLDTNLKVAAINITAITDKRVATAGRHITAINVGKVLKDMADTDLSDYPYLGQLNVLTSGTTITINSALSPTEPPTETHRMTTVSPVGVPAVSSAGSGLVV